MIADRFLRVAGDACPQGFEATLQLASTAIDGGLVVRG
jgi:hypothetical protein